MYKKAKEKLERLRDKIKETINLVLGFLNRHVRVVLTILAGIVIVLGVLHFRRPCGDVAAVTHVEVKEVSKSKNKVLPDKITPAAPKVPRSVAKTQASTGNTPVVTNSTVPSAISTKATNIATKPLLVVVKPPKPVSVHQSKVSTFQRNPLYESNPLFDLYDRIVLGVSTDTYFVDGVARINSELNGTPNRVFIKYESGNAVPGLRFIPPRKQVEMGFGIYFGDQTWQELAVPGAEIHLILRSSPCNHTTATVREARYIYYDCAGGKHEYPAKVQ